MARAWEAYDIRLVLERNWPALGPKLAGKLHVITGALDTFYLEGAVRLLKESLAALESDAVVEIIPGKDHSSILDAELAARLDREMKAAVDRDHEHAPASDASPSPSPAPAYREVILASSDPVLAPAPTEPTLRPTPRRDLRHGRRARPVRAVARRGRDPDVRREGLHRRPRGVPPVHRDG